MQTAVLFICVAAIWLTTFRNGWHTCNRPFARVAICNYKCHAQTLWFICTGIYQWKAVEHARQYETRNLAHTDARNRHTVSAQAYLWQAVNVQQCITKNLTHKRSKPTHSQCTGIPVTSCWARTAVWNYKPGTHRRSKPTHSQCTGIPVTSC